MHLSITVLFHSAAPTLRSLRRSVVCVLKGVEAVPKSSFLNDPTQKALQAQIKPITFLNKGFWKIFKQYLNLNASICIQRLSN
jgi:hypothetical protein